MSVPQLRKTAAALPVMLAVALGVTSLGPIAAQTTTTKQVQPKAKAKARTKDEQAKLPLDLNKATEEEMIDLLPGVGEATARKIITGRPYATLGEVVSKGGVPARVVEGWGTEAVVTPHVGPTAKAKAKAKESEAKSKVMTAPAAGAGGAKVDLNHATLAELEELPEIGPAHAKAIVAARPFKSVDDLESIKGLSKAKVDELRGLVVVGKPVMAPVTAPRTTATAPAPASTTTAPVTKPAMKAASKGATKTVATRLAPGEKVNINTASREALDVLPGIGPVKAQAIIETRPFAKIEDVMKVKGIKEGEFAKIKDMIKVD